MITQPLLCLHRRAVNHTIFRNREPIATAMRQVGISPAPVYPIRRAIHHLLAYQDMEASLEAELAESAQPARALKPPVGMLAGSICGITAAVLYTGANIALRKCVGVDPFLVSAVKAIPTLVALAPYLIWMRYTGQTIATSYAIVPRFIAVSLLGQFVGNAAFQISLSIIGLAASVPITLGTLIVGGAVLANRMLRERVTLRLIFAMITMIAAIVGLSMPDATTTPAESINQYPVWVGAVCAAASGFAYALFGVVVRQALIGGLSAPATMFISGLVGTISLCAFCLLHLGVQKIGMTPAEFWPMMTAAGVFNFVAFIALATALKALPVVAVNLINASQVAMAAIAGVLLFSEPFTTQLCVGLMLTFAGLAILASRRRTSTDTTTA